MSQMINLAELANGAVAERVNLEVKKVLENIADPNTNAKTKRKVVLTLTFQADDNRDVVNVSVHAKPTLAPAKDIDTKIIMDYDTKGQITGAELKSGLKGQTFIDPDGGVSSDTGEKIIDFRKQGGANQ